MEVLVILFGFSIFESAVLLLNNINLENHKFIIVNQELDNSYPQLTMCPLYY